MKNAFIIAMAAQIATLFAAATGASAQTASEYPTKSIRLIAPEVAGSATDIVSRILAVRLSEALGQQVSVDNLLGTPGIEAAVKAAPDGHTLVYGSSSTLALAPHINSKLPYDPFNDLLPVSLFVITPTLLTVNPSVPASNVRELIALMKANPNQLKTAFAGVGTSSHVAGLMFTTMTGVSAVHVAYRGASPAIAAVLDNEAQWMFTPMAAPLPHVRSGKLRPIAVGSTKRSSILPDVPTAAEAGVSGYSSGTWGGILVPKGTSQPIIDKLNMAIVKTLSSPTVKEQFVQRGSEPLSSTPAEFARFMREEYERLGKVAKIAGITAN